MTFDRPPRLADLVIRVVNDDLVIYDATGETEIDRTTLSEGIMQAEELWHFTREAARVLSSLEAPA